MAVHNTEIRDIFDLVADLLEIKGENPFRVRAYREAARVIHGMSEQIDTMVKAGRDLTEFRGIGKDLAGKIVEITETGRLSQLEQLKTEIPPSLCELLQIPELGPRKIAAVYEALGVKTLEDLKQAALAGKIAALKGFGKKSEGKILESIERTQSGTGRRMLWCDVEPFAAAIEKHLGSQPGVEKVIVAGSFRRGKETIGDLDILATCRPGGEEPVMEAFVRFEDVRDVIARGKTKTSVRLRSGLQVDLRIVPGESYGAALHYFTGSKAHNIAVRKLGVERKLKISEYGVFSGEERIAGDTEASVFAAVGLPFIEPELRENMGEIEAARSGRLPELVTLDAIRGDLHAHTTRTDGRNTLTEMAEAARDRGYEYLAITEHSQKVAMARGLNEKDLWAYMETIAAADAVVDGITLLKGIECDILVDGSLDLPDSVLRELDIVICSVHYNQRLSREEQMTRILRAMDNPNLKILGHPTGRLINSREPMDLDLETIIAAAAERGVVLELNAQPDRLDLPHNYCKLAVEQGVKIALSTDAHSTDGLKRMKLGITEARRGWLTAADIVNTRALAELRRLLRRN